MRKGQLVVHATAPGVGVPASVSAAAGTPRLHADDAGASAVLPAMSSVEGAHARRPGRAMDPPCVGGVAAAPDDRYQQADG